MEGERRCLAVRFAYSAGDKQGEVVEARLRYQRIDLAAHDSPNPGMLADRRCIVYGNMHWPITGLETAVGPEPVDGEVPEQHNANGKEFGDVIAHGET